MPGTDRSQQNLDKNSPAHAAQAGDHTAHAPTPKEDAAAKQSESQGTGHQTVDDHLKSGSHASKAQVIDAMFQMTLAVNI